MKLFAAAAMVMLGVGAKASAENIFVRDASVSSAEAEHRDDLTNIVRGAVKQLPGDELAPSEKNADAVLQPTLMGSDGSYSVRVDRLQNSKVVASTERSVGDWRDISEIAHQAALTTLASNDKIASNGDGDQSMPSAYPSRSESQSASNSQNSNRQDPQASQQASESNRNEQPAASNNEESSQARQPRYVSQNSSSSSDDSSANSSGESRGSNPIQALRSSPQNWTAGIGPGFGIGMNSSNIMYSVTGGYRWDFNPRFAGKAQVEADLGSGSDNAQLIDATVGADAYLTQINMGPSTKPFVTADVGVGTARNQASQTGTGLTAGAGAGFRIAASQSTNMDLLLHYELMTATVGGSNPSVLGVRAAFNF